jgi:hypothetical protein
MKKLLRIFIVAVVSTLFMTACSDPGGSLNIEFKNASSYDITLAEMSPQYENGEVITEVIERYNIKVGESQTVSAYQKGAVDWWTFWVYTRITCIKFGDMEMVYMGERYGNIENYELIKSNDNAKFYRYTFTDEDYQYALENGQKVDQK